MKYMPQEIEVWYVIPAIRRELAKAMAALGMRQKDIAKCLNLTEPAVSQYLKFKRAKDVYFDKDVIKRIETAANRIIKDNKMMMSEVEAVCDIVKKNGILCKIASKYHELPKNCKICLR